MVFNLNGLTSNVVVQWLFFAVLVSTVITTIVKFTRDGFYRNACLIVRLVCLFFMIKYLPAVFSPLVAKLPLPETVLGMTRTAACGWIVVIAIAVIYFVFAGISKAIINKVLKNRIPMANFWGFLISIPATLVLLVLITTNFTDSWLVRNGKEIAETPISKIYKEKVNDVICVALTDSGIPSDFEQIIISSTVKPGEEGFVETKEAMDHTMAFFDNNSAYLSELNSVDKKVAAVNDMIVTLDTVGAYKGLLADVVKGTLSVEIEDWSKALNGTDIGDAKEQLLVSAINFGCGQDTIDYLYYCFEGTTVYAPSKTLAQLQK